MSLSVLSKLGSDILDRYTEQIILKKPDIKQKALLAVMIAVICAGMYLMMFISFSKGIAVIAVGAFFTYLVKQSFNAEYEYLFVNGDCDISRIINKSSRKDIYSFKESDVTRVMPYNSDKCQNEFEVNANLTVKDFSSGIKDNSDNWYVFLANIKSGTAAIILELNEKSLEHIAECYKKKMD